MTQRTDADATWVALGARLAAARIAAGLSKRAAAERAGISEGWWRSLEAGVRTLGRGQQQVAMRSRAETVVAAAVAVGVDPAEALALVGHDPALAAAVEVRQPVVVALEAELACMREELRALRGAVERLVAALLDPPPVPPVPEAQPSPGAVPARAGAQS